MYKLICGRTRKVLFQSDRKIDAIYEHQKYRRSARVYLQE